MLVTLLLVFLTREVISQYIHHPLGAVSFVSNTNFHNAAGYSYIAPTGQNVNVKFGASAASQPHPYHISAVPQFSAPRFAFHSAPAQLPLPANPEPRVSFYQPQQVQPDIFRQNFRTAPVAPRPESLFSPANGFGPANTEKQFQAYKDYLKQVAEEDARAAQQSAVPDEYDPDCDCL